MDSVRAVATPLQALVRRHAGCNMGLLTFSINLTLDG